MKGKGLTGQGIFYCLYNGRDGRNKKRSYSEDLFISAPENCYIYVWWCKGGEKRVQNSKEQFD